MAVLTLVDIIIRENEASNYLQDKTLSKQNMIIYLCFEKISRYILGKEQDSILFEQKKIIYLKAESHVRTSYVK